jgi:excisionase family DNA binding protein
MTDLRSPYDMLTPPAAAQYLGVSVRTIWYYVTRGRLSGHHVGRNTFFQRAQLDEVRAQRVKGLIKPGWPKGRKRK